MTEAEELELLELEEQAAKAGAAAPPSAQPVPTAPDEPSYAESFGRGAAQGLTASFGDEIQGGIQSYGNIMMDEWEAAKEALRTGDFSPLTDGRDPRETIQRFIKGYKLERNSARLENERARQANPKTFLAGNVTGGLMTAPLTGGGGTLRSAVTAGAGLGALAGLGGSNADLTEGEVGDALVDTATGGVLGAGAGVVGHGVAKLTPIALRAIRAKLSDKAVEYGRKALNPRADIRNATNRAVPDDVVEEALRSKAIRPFSGTEATLGRLKTLTEEQGAVYGSILDELEANGVSGPDKADLAMRLFREFEEMHANTGANKAAANVLHSEMDNALVTNPRAPSLGLRQSENIKRHLQELANYDTTVPRTVNEARKAAAATYRQANEDAINEAARAAGPRSEVAELASEFVPVKQRLGRLIGAREAAQMGANKAAQSGGVGINVFDVAQAVGATGMAPVPAAGTAMAGKAWKGVAPATLATGANAASKVARAATYATMGPGVSALTRGTVPAYERAKLPAPSPLESIQVALERDPEAFGKYGPQLARLLQEGKKADVAVRHKALMETNAEYRAAYEAATAQH